MEGHNTCMAHDVLQNPWFIIEVTQNKFSLEHLQENPTKAQYLQKIPKPSDGTYTRINEYPFPSLSNDKIIDVIDDGLAKAVSV